MSLKKSVVFVSRTLLIIIILLPVILFFASRLTVVKTFFSNKLTEVLQDNLNTKVQIGEIVYNPPFDIVAKNIFIADYQGDTLFYVNKLSVRPLFFNYKKNKLFIDNIKIDKFRTEYRIDTSGYSNFDYFIANLPTSNKTDSSHSSFSIKIRKIQILRSSALYTNAKHLKLPYNFDIDTINILRFDTEITNFIYSDTLIALNLEQFHLFEQNGFRIRNICTKIKITNTQTSIKNLVLRLNKTRLWFKNFSIGNSNKTKIFNLSLSKFSSINLSDLGYFSKDFRNYNEKFRIGANILGPLSNLQIKYFSLKYKKNTHAYLAGNIIGLPNAKNLYFDFSKINLGTCLSDIKSIKNPQTKEAFVKIPPKINIPDTITLNGDIKGFVNNFGINANINSSSGNIAMNLDFLQKNKTFSISGTFNTHKLDLAYILKNNALGKISLQDTIDLSIDAQKKPSGYNNLYTSELELKNYNYKKVKILSSFKKDNIKSKLIISDSNLTANADLDFYYNKETKRFKTKFKFDIDTARLYPLHLIANDPMAAFSFGVNGQFEGKDINNIEGNLEFSKPLYLVKNLQLLKIKHFKIDIQNVALLNNTYFRIVQINSDFISGSLKGTFDFPNLVSLASNIPQFYFTSLNKKAKNNIFTSDSIVSNNFKIDLKINNIQPIFDVFAPSIYISNNTRITGGVYNQKHSFDILLSSDSIKFSSNKIKNLITQIKGNDSTLKITLQSDSLGLGKINFQQLRLNALAGNDLANIKLKWHNKSEKKNYGKLKFLLQTHRDSLDNLVTKIIIPKDTMFINNVLWTIRSKSITSDSSGISIQNFTISDKNAIQNIGIKGKISKNPADTLNFLISNFDISQLNPLLKGLTLNGFLMTKAVATNLLSAPSLFLTNRIEKFAINKVKLGLLEQDFELYGKNKIMQTNLTLQKYGKVRHIINNKSIFKDTLYRALKLVAKYNLKKSNYDADLIIDNLKIRPFAPYFKDYLAFSRNSNLNGHLKIKGDKVLYNIEGFMNLFGSFKIFPTGVSYTINGGMHVGFEHNLIKIYKTVIVGPDLVGDATLKGEIKHHNFKDLFLDVSMKADTILFLNLPRTNKSKYYGKVVGSGNLNISGFLQNLSLKADVTAEPATKLTILLDKPGEVSNKTSIVTFINPNDTTKEKNIIVKQKSSKSNFDFDLNLNLNPEAKFKLIFDEMTNEGLDIQGQGNIKLKKTALGDLVLFGKIGIVQGNYNFVLQNIINRKFKIKQGSYISFNGTPTSGLLDITTVYSVKNVNLYNLLKDDKYSDQKTEADCYIYLKGPILKPKVRFGVDLPKADRKIADQVKALDEANINKQFLSLLLIGRFQPLPGLQYDPNANFLSGTFNAGELISNQLNSFLSNLGSNVNLDVNYITGSNASTQQFDVALSVPLLNEKVSINTDVGVAGDNTNTSNQNNFIGDFEVDVKLNKKGNLQLKAYNKTNRNNFYEQGYTQGIGLLYKSDLDNFFKRDTTKKHKKIRKK
jgi:hypothetical protein